MNKRRIFLAVIVVLAGVVILLCPVKSLHQINLGFNAEMEDIKFYGRVVDQFDIPVVGALVDLEGGGAMLAASAGRGRAITNEDGRFSATVKGASLLVSRISHPTIKFRFPNHLQTSGGGGSNISWDFNTPRVVKI